MASDELFPVVNEKGEVVGSATRGECHSGSKILHPVVHLHVFNRVGKIYLQKRSMNKDIQPGKWDTAVGGHVDYGETIEEALRREVREEIGLTDFVPQHLASYVFESAIEREMVNTFYTVTGKTSFEFDPAEIDEARFWSHEEIREMRNHGIFTPNFLQEYDKLALGERLIV